MKTLFVLTCTAIVLITPFKAFSQSVDCATAEIICSNSATKLDVNTTNSSTTGLPVSICGNISTRGTWFKIIANKNGGNIKVSFANVDTSKPLNIGIFSGSCSTLVAVPEVTGCIAGATGTFELNFIAIASSVYYVVIDDMGNPQIADFTIQVSGSAIIKPNPPGFSFSPANQCLTSPPASVIFTNNYTDSLLAGDSLKVHINFDFTTDPNNWEYLTSKTYSKLYTASGRYRPFFSVTNECTLPTPKDGSKGFVAEVIISDLITAIEAIDTSTNPKVTFAPYPCQFSNIKLKGTATVSPTPPPAIPAPFDSTYITEWRFDFTNDGIYDTIIKVGDTGFNKDSFVVWYDYSALPRPITAKLWAKGFCDPDSTTIVLYSDTFQVSVTPKTQTICQGDVSTLLPLDTACIGCGGSPPVKPYTYTWREISGPTSGLIINTPNAPQTTLTIPNSFSGKLQFELEVNDSSSPNFCMNKDTLELIVRPTPGSDFTIQADICVNVLSSDITFTGSPLTGQDANYSWNFGLDAIPTEMNTMGPHNVLWNSSGLKIVTLVVTDSGCTSIISVDSIYVIPATLAQPGSDTTICLSSGIDCISYTLNGLASMGQNLLWTNNDIPPYSWNESAPTICLPIPDLNNPPVYKFFLEANAPNCPPNKDSITIDFFPYQKLDAGGTYTLCQGPIQLFGIGATNSITWSALTPDASILSGQSTAQPIVQESPTQDTSLFLFSSTNTTTGCTATDTAYVVKTSGVLKEILLLSEPTICLGSTIQLKAKGGDYYTFYENNIIIQDDSIDFLNVTPADAGSYQYKAIITQTGCTPSSTSPINVEVLPNPVANAGVDQEINTGELVTLNAAGGINYSWSNGLSGDSIKVSPSVTTTYYVVVNNGTCSAIDYVTVKVLDYSGPEFTFLGHIFGIFPADSSVINQCDANYSQLSTIDPLSGSEFYLPCTDQNSETFAGRPANQFRLKFDPLELTYTERLSALHTKRVYTKGKIYLQLDSLGNNNWIDILGAENVSLFIDLDCPNTISGRIIGEFKSGNTGLLAELNMFGNNQFSAEFSNVVPTIFANYSDYTISFNLLPVINPVIVESSEILNTNTDVEFNATGVSMQYNSYVSTLFDTAKATVIHYSQAPPHAVSIDTVATIFNNSYWEIGTTMDSLNTKVCFRYDSTSYNTADFSKYYNIVSKEGLDGRWQISPTSIPFLNTDKTKLCATVTHTSNWAIAITKPDAKSKIDTSIINSGTIPSLKKIEFPYNGTTVEMSLIPLDTVALKIARYDINPGGDLPPSITQFSSAFWRAKGFDGIKTSFGIDPSALDNYDPLNNGKDVILYRRDAVSDWIELPTTRVKKGMKEELKTVRSGYERGDGDYALGKTANPVLLYAATVVTNLACVGDSTVFSSIVSGGVEPFTYSWSGDDGFSSTQNVPTHIYSNQGSYNYSLTITDANLVEYYYSDTAFVNYVEVKLAVADSITEGDSALFTDLSIGAVSWLWDFGDGATATTQHPYHTFNTKGTFNVCLTINNCESTCTSVVVINGTNIHELIANGQLSIYPNPVTENILTINYTAPIMNQLNISILDVSGRIIFSEKKHNLNGNYQSVLDLTDQPKGMYLLKIVSDYGMISKKILLQ